MPDIHPMNLPPLKPIITINDPREYATIKQKSLVSTLCERRKLPVPDMKHMKMGEASVLISRMLN